MGAYDINQTRTYASRAVFVSSGAYDTDQTISGSLRQVARVQSLDWSTPYPVEHSTYLDYGDEAYLTAHTPVEVTIDLLHTNGRAEQALGLVDLVGPNGTLAFNLDQEKNLYIAYQNTPGRDDIGAPTGLSNPQTVIALGQALMTTYNLRAQVGGLTQARATMNCLTAFSYTGQVGNRVPAVNYRDGTQLTGQFVIPAAFSQYDPNVTGYDNPIAASAIAARDMYMVFGDAVGPFALSFSGAQSCYLQSFDLTMAFDRRELKPLGNVYPPARALHYPIRVDLSAEAIVNTYQRDQLNRISCLGSGQSIYLIVKQPCSNATLFGLYFDKLQLMSQSVSTSITNPDAVTMQWNGLITTPTSSLFSPVVNFLIDADTQQPFGTTW